MRTIVVTESHGVIIEHTIDGVNQLRLGMGDKIERIAQPMALAIDNVAGTKIAKCGGCKKMKERLNAGMPFAEALKLRLKGS